MLLIEQCQSQKQNYYLNLQREIPCLGIISEELWTPHKMFQFDTKRLQVILNKYIHEQQQTPFSLYPWQFSEIYLNVFKWRISNMLNL